MVRALVALALFSCSPRPEPVTTTVPPPRAEPDAGPPAPPLPPGVLAQAQGKQGLIQVVDKDGMRLLLVGGVVHAAVATDGRRGADPVVALARALRPAGKTALVIGLGSGRTAGDLAAAGYQVEACDLEPAIIEYARKYFGYQGQAVAMDGREFLERNQRLWDLVLMDASGGDPPAPPQGLVDDQALRLLAERTAAGGISVLRLLDAPHTPEVERMQRRLRDLGGRRFVQMFGSGTGDERQNLYLVAGDQGINFVDATGVALWPLGPDDAPDWADPAPLSTAGETAPARRIRLAGYVVRLRENGGLALDLPHWEMGAARYLLSGPWAGELAAMVPAGATFPTAGDIASDADPKGTLHEVLGGGGVKRSDVRFSPVVAVVEGSATLRSVVHPDAAPFVPAELRGDAPTDPLLPYGGALYDLSVHAIVWKADAAGWAKVRAALAPSAAQVVKSLAKGDIQQAHRHLRRYRSMLGQQGVPLFLPPVIEAQDLLLASQRRTDLFPLRPYGGSRLGPRPPPPPPMPTPLERGVFCDQVLHVRTVAPSERINPDVLAIDRALLRCAIAGFAQVAANRKDARAREAAGRLLVLHDLTVDWNDPRTAKAAESKKRALRVRYSDLEEIDRPLAAAPFRPTPD